MLYKYVMLRQCCLVYLKCLRAVLDSIRYDTWLVASLERIYYNWVTDTVDSTSSTNFFFFNEVKDGWTSGRNWGRKVKVYCHLYCGVYFCKVGFRKLCNVVGKKHRFKRSNKFGPCDSGVTAHLHNCGSAVHCSWASISFFVGLMVKEVLGTCLITVKFLYLSQKIYCCFLL